MVGMLLYLVGSAMPDIDYTVHQCTRFFQIPNHSHDIGLKHISSYLKITCTKGFIMKLNPDEMRLYLYADTDFSGLFTTEDKIEPNSVKSHTGILLIFA